MSARFRLVGALALLLMLTALATTNAPSAEATVTLPCNSYWAYAGQFTGSVNGDYVCPTNPYWGYVGVDGNIETPSALPSALTSDDHSLGFTSALFNNYAAWLQVGWMAGYIGDPGIHIQSFTQYRLYFEQTYPAGGYYVKDVSPLAYGGNVIYRIEYIGNGCWNTSYNYNVLTDQSCTYPASGMMVANSETGNGGTDTFSSMPRSWFGSSTPATNATMRLKGGSGWGDWSSAINTGTTQYRPYFYYSISDRYRYFTTVGSTQ